MGYNDRINPRNGPEYHTGKACIDRGCARPAGTHWSPLWCFECNAARMKRTNDQMADIVRQQDEQ